MIAGTAASSGFREASRAFAASSLIAITRAEDYPHSICVLSPEEDLASVNSAGDLIRIEDKE